MEAKREQLKIQAEGEADYIAGMIENGTMAITTTSQVDVMEYAYAQVSDANLTAGNIADGVTILGVTGTYSGGITPTGTAYLQLNTLTDVSAYEFAYCEDTNGSYTAGYTGGTSYGYDWGYPIGYAEGTTYGEEIGYASGYTAGTTYGYDWGYPIGYTNGTTYGESIGYTTGYSAGYSYGYDIGYSEGVTEGYAEATTPYSEQYLTLEATDDREQTLTIENNGVNISYSSDGGTTWTSIASGDSADIIMLSGDKVMLKGVNNTLWVDDNGESFCGLRFEATGGSFTAYGNVMSLLEGDNFGVQLNTNYTNQFNQLFIDFAQLKHAKDIVLPVNGELVDYAFSEMFSGTGIEDVPVICTAPSRAALGQGTYADMFGGCDNLKYVVVVTDQAIATDPEGNGEYDMLEIGSFGGNLTNAYLVVKSSQAAHVKEAVDYNEFNIIVLGYDATNDSDCYSTDAETFCLRMAAKYLPEENYNEGYDDGYTDGEDAGGSLDPNDSIVTDASKWQVFNYLASNYIVTSSQIFNDYAIEAMDVEYYAELCDALGAPCVVAVDMFNPRGSVDVIEEGSGVTIDYQMNDPEDPNTNAYISIDIDLDEGQSVGLSFASPTDNGDGLYILGNIYWCLTSNTNGEHWLHTAANTGTYNILLEADGNGGCTMTITEPEPEP